MHIRRASLGLPLYSRGNFSSPAASPPSRCLVLTALVQPLFKQNRISPGHLWTPPPKPWTTHTERIASRPRSALACTGTVEPRWPSGRLGGGGEPRTARDPVVVGRPISSSEQQQQENQHQRESQSRTPSPGRQNRRAAAGTIQVRATPLMLAQSTLHGASVLLVPPGAAGPPTPRRPELIRSILIGQPQHERHRPGNNQSEDEGAPDRTYLAPPLVARCVRKKQFTDVARQ